MSKNFKAWPEGWPRSIDYPQMPVYSILDQTAARVPDRTALIFEGMELTFGELKELSDRFAAALWAMGVKKGKRVSIHMTNCPQFAIAYYGILKTGAIFTPLSPLFSPREAVHQLNDSGAETLISLDTLYQGIKKIIPETPVQQVITTSIADCHQTLGLYAQPDDKREVRGTLDMVSLLKEREPKAPEVVIDVKEDLAHLAYTGGTTGVSKGVMVTHFNVVANAIQYGNWFCGADIKMVDGVLKMTYPPGVDPLKDRPLAFDCETTMVAAPWFHAMGTLGYLNLQILCGNTMVVLPRFDAGKYLEAVVEYGATQIGGAPQLYVPLFNHPDFESYDLSSVKLARSGAAPLPFVLLEKMLEVFSGGTVMEGYGLTECTMGATANLPFRSGIRPGSVGIPLFDTECKVADLETGEELPPGGEGEICIRGPQVTAGYWNRPEETAETFKNGWLHTGDIGRMDEDGFFYITDRKKDLIIYKGYNVYPREIEEVLYEHPAVQRCAVAGRLDKDSGEIPVAFVELKSGARPTADEIMEHANSQIAYYKKIREVIFVDAMPLSAAGKILKKELKKTLDNA